MATGKQLMKEIYDQFLLCKICFEIYRRPKTLSCLHTFCADCIEKHNDAEYERSYRYMLYNRSVSCPICRKKTELPTGGIRRLPDNFLVANLADVVSRRKPSEFQECEICKPDIPSKHKQAKSKCLDCSKLLCRFCEELHRKTKVTKNHSLFDIEVEREIECKVHQDEVVRFYCEPCEACICVVCTFQEHKGHEISSFSEGMQKYQKSLDTIVTMCRERIANVKEQIDLITNCETVIKNAEEQIRDMAIDSISEIRKNERKLVDNLHEVYGEDTFQFLKAKQPLKETLENLQSTCNLTDIISKDRRIELLLLRREIKDKVGNLLDSDLTEPPANVMKQVKFVPGKLEFGYLNVEGQSLGKVDPQLPLKYTDTRTTECQTNTISSTNRATLTNHLMFDISQNKVTQTLITQTKESSTSPIIAASPKIRSRFTMTSPVNVENCQTMTSAIVTNQARTQTLAVKMIDSSSNTLHTAPTDTKFTNTPSVPEMVERSTLTRLTTFKDKVTDTRGLVVLKDSETKMIVLGFKDTECMTDHKRTNNQSTLTTQPNHAEKSTITPRTPTNERPTMTNTVFTYDVGVGASVSGIDKAIATKAIVTVDSGYGEGSVSTRDQNVATYTLSFPKTLDAYTMYDHPCQRNNSSETEQIVKVDKHIATETVVNIDRLINTDQTELMDCSTETDIVGEVIKLEKAKDEKLLLLIENCISKGITCDFLMSLLARAEVDRNDVSTNTDDVTMRQMSYGLSSSSLAESDLEFYDVDTAMDTSESESSVCERSWTRKSTQDAGTSTQHSVHTSDQMSGTVVHHYTDTACDAVHTSMSENSVQTYIETKEIGILKRPIAVTTSTSTKKLKLCSQSAGTDRVVHRHQETNTNIQHLDSSCDPIKFSIISKCEGTEKVISKDSSCGSNVKYTERGSSPIRIRNTVDQGSDALTVSLAEASVSVKPDAIDGFTDAPVVHMCDTGVSPFRVKLVNKSVSPIYNLIPKRSTSTCTKEVVLNHRASSPIRCGLVQRGVNTMKQSTVNRASSPVKFKGRDFGVMITPNMSHKESETTKTETCDIGTGTKRIRTLNKSIGMEQILYAEKQTCTAQIHTINKMVSTDNISSVDKHTMTFDVTAAYKNHVQPVPAVTVNRGTNTVVINTMSSTTSPERQFFSEKASSPVRVITVNKGIMANKAQIIEPKEKFQTAGLITKPLKPIADSPKSNLESIEELRESDEEHCSKESQTDTPPRSPKVALGRKAISAMDLSQSSPFTHKEKFVLSVPRMGKKLDEQSTFSPFRCANTKLVCKVETATNTKDVGVDTKGTSTPPVETEDKAVCTEAIHVTKDDKMAACISKLQAVRQRLEQHPVYVQAPTSPKQSPSPPPPTEKSVPISKSLSLQTSKSTDSVPTSRVNLLTDLKQEGSKSISECVVRHKKCTDTKKAIDSKTNTDSFIAAAQKSLEPLVSPLMLRRTLIKQDSSDDSEDSHSKLKHSLARKKKPGIAQLLARSSSLPEQDSPPANIPKPKLRTIVPHVIPKLNVEEVTSPRMSRKSEANSKLPPKARQRKGSPVMKGARMRPVLAGMPAFGASPAPVIPMTPERQRARQERLAKLRKEKQTNNVDYSSQVTDGKSSTRPKSPPQKVSIRGGKPKPSLQAIITQEESSSSN